MSNIHPDSPVLRMQAVAAVSEIFHESERKSLVSYCNIAFFSIIQHQRIPVKECQCFPQIQSCLRERGFFQCNAEGEIGVRHEIPSFELACSHTPHQRVKAFQCRKILD